MIALNPKQAGGGERLAPPSSFFCPSTLIFDTITVKFVDISWIEIYLSAIFSLLWAGLEKLGFDHTFKLGFPIAISLRRIVRNCFRLCQFIVWNCAINANKEAIKYSRHCVQWNLFSFLHMNIIKLNIKFKFNFFSIWDWNFIKVQFIVCH